MQSKVTEPVCIVSQPPPKARRAFPLRFSLLSLCAVVAVACVAAAWYGMRKREQAAIKTAASLTAQLKSQEAEIDRLRAELGYLTISDRTKVHALQQECRDDYHWRWRVFLPPGKKWKMCYGMGKIPRHGFKDVPHGEGTIDSGEFTIEASIGRNVDGQRQFVVAGPSSRISQSLSEEQFQQLVTAGFSATGVGQKQTEVLNPAEPTVLLRLRQNRAIPGPPGSSSFASSDDPEFGFLIWVE